MPIPDAKRPAVDRALRAAFGTTELDAVVPLGGGLSGALIYRIRVGGIAYLLRIEGPRDAFRDPGRWYACMRIAAEAVIAPRVRYADPADGVAIMEFIVERSLSQDFPGPREDLITEAAQTLRALHQAPAFPPLVDYMDGMEAILGEHRATGLLDPEATAPLFARWAELKGAYRTDPADLVSSHNDLNPRNVLYDGRRLWFVDWESSFLADRYVDLATLANFMTSGPAEAELLLRTYLGRAPDGRQRARLEVMRQVNHLFYGLIMLNAVAAQRPGVAAPAGLAAPDLAEIHQGLGAGTYVLEGWEGQVTYGKARLNAALAGMTAPAFAEALRVLA